MKIFVLKGRAVLSACALFFVFFLFFRSSAGSAVPACFVRRHLPICRADVTRRVVSLTIDTAGFHERTAEILNVLEMASARATFFITGEWADRYPDLVREIHAHGHEIGNHTDTHPHLLEKDMQTVREELENCSRKLRLLTRETPRLVRVPYGEFDDRLLARIQSLGYTAIGWDVNSTDWRAESPLDIETAVLSRVSPGSILLFHNAGEYSVEGIRKIVEKLSDEGYQFVTVSELLA